ncbi:uncharacterized protein LOC131218854 [Magnolia sinica]|uniref:uncharacterized protein LOC131218854 n=1 Tax=Magnolia sinica TaxID=86752 RepID=UPI002657D8FA|nr:uncharacterized protein LOC131218854 [Magnolia sinica]
MEECLDHKRQRQQQHQQKLLTEEQLEQRRERLRTYMSQRWLQMTSEERERLRERRRNTDRLRRLRMTEEQLERRREQRRNYMRRRRNIALGLPPNTGIVGYQPRIKYEPSHVGVTNILRVQGRTRLNHIRQQARMRTTQAIERMEDGIQVTKARIDDQVLLDRMKSNEDSGEGHEIFWSGRRMRLTEIRRLARLAGSQQSEKTQDVKMEIEGEDSYHDEGIDQSNGILQNQRRLRLTEIRRQARLLSD